MFCSKVAVFFSFSAFISFVFSWPLDPGFSRWIWQSSVVAGDWLYIDGGEFYELVDGTSTGTSGFDTIAIDLTTSWTNATVTAISNAKPINMESVRRPQMWYDAVSNNVYEWGGWPYNDDNNYFTYALWSFQAGGGDTSWESNPDPAINNAEFTAAFGAATAYSNSTFYSIGGAVPEPTSDPETPISGVTSYDFTSGLWSNSSSTGVSPESDGFIVLGESVFVPNFGESGVLVVLGGDTPSNQTYVYQGGEALMNLSSIPVYDVANDTWYRQTASGRIPPGRSEFCMTGAAAADNSSFEIFLYGGSTNGTWDQANPDGRGFQDVWVLSLPSFHWFRSPASGQQRRSNHFCQILRGPQMLVIGGVDPSAKVHDDITDVTAGVPDPWVHGLGIFNMTSLTWASEYTPNVSAYQPATVIEQYKASSQYPASWDDSALAGIFTVKKKSSNSSTPIGAIVGGVVGGVVVLILIAGLVFWLARRNKRKNRAGAYQAQPTESPNELAASNNERHEMYSPEASTEMATPEPKNGTAGRFFELQGSEVEPPSRDPNKGTMPRYG